MYRLRKIEVITINKNGAREATATFTVKSAPYPYLTDKEFHLKRALRKYLKEYSKGMYKSVFTAKKDTRIVKVVTNKAVFYL